MIIKTAQYNNAVTMLHWGFPDLFPFLYQRGKDVLSTYQMKGVRGRKGALDPR